jgi:hypothetical protein|tara:strand:+ start:187 stop:690 length:504 start_codon:yes stop_codon:yes gene_type:complete
MIYRFRVILDNDTDDDIFRDIEINKSNNLEDFHNTITQSFGFEGNEMASFYLSDQEWNQGEEISLFDLGDVGETNRLMSDVLLDSVMDKNNNRLIFVYDFLNLWTFLIELVEIVELTSGVNYPNLIFSKGQIPSKIPEKKFKAENILEDENNEDELGDYNEYDDFYN